MVTVISIIVTVIGIMVTLISISHSKNSGNKRSNLPAK